MLNLGGPDDDGIDDNKFNKVPGERPIPEGFEVAGCCERLDSELVGTEPRIAEEVRGLIESCRDPGPGQVPTFDHPPANIPIYSGTVVDADGKEPDYIMNPMPEEDQ